MFIFSLNNVRLTWCNNSTSFSGKCCIIEKWNHFIVLLSYCVHYSTHINIIIMRGNASALNRVPGPAHIHTHTHPDIWSALCLVEILSVNSLLALGHTSHTAHFTAAAFSLPSFILPLSALLRKPLGNRCHGNMINWRHSSHWIGIDQQIQDKQERHTHCITAVTFDLYMI